MHWVPQQGNPGTGSCRIMCELKQGTSPRKSRAARVLRVVQETLVALSFMTSNFEDGQSTSNGLPTFAPGASPYSY